MRRESIDGATEMPFRDNQRSVVHYRVIDFDLPGKTAQRILVTLDLPGIEGIPDYDDISNTTAANKANFFNH
jgi:hypothetical protein